MKYEWRKQEKDLYNPKQIPRLTSVPAQNFIAIKGNGNPNEEDFSLRVSALYSLAYGIKMAYKKSCALSVQTDFDDFTVYPLEGIWHQREDTDTTPQTSQTQPLIKENLTYTIMIRQPNFITEAMILSAKETVQKKKPSALLDEIFFLTTESATYTEILHIGPFDDEPASFAKMDAYTKEAGLHRTEPCHTEIYLSNFNRTAKEKLKTILRYKVE